MQKITKFLCGIIKQAAKMTTQPFNIYDKDAFGDVVTDIDKQVEAFLVGKLNQKYPDFEIVSEEYNPDHKLTNNCFIIDPIDGTKNFAAGIPLWGMQMAAIQDGEVIASVIYLPKIDELYYADCNGAFLNGKPLAMSEAIRNQRPIYGVEGGEKFPALIQLEKEVNRNFRYFSSSSVGYAWTAAGRMSGFSFRKDTKWDYIPGIYLVKMAGGCVIDQPGLHVGATNEKMLQILSKYPEDNKEKPAPAKTATRAKTKN